MNSEQIQVRYSILAEDDTCCLSCGGAIDYSKAQNGEISVDLGSGRGSDVIRLAEEVGETGFAFGIDQYGRHFQSLNYLKQLLPAYVKVDHSYTNQVDEITGDSEFLAAVCQAATKLAITTVATRVESQSILDLLAGLHIDAYQGFISPPVKLEKFDVPANPPEFQ